MANALPGFSEQESARIREAQRRGILTSEQKRAIIDRVRSAESQMPSATSGVAETPTGNLPAAEENVPNFIGNLPRPGDDPESLRAAMREKSEGRFEAFKRGLDRLGAGVVQVGLKLAERAGIVEPGEADRFTEAELERQKEMLDEFRMRYGDDIAFDIAFGAGTAGPLMLAPGGGPVAAIGTGALTGAAQFMEPGQSRALSTGVGAAAGAIPAAGAFVRRATTRRATMPFSRSPADEVAAARGDPMASAREATRRFTREGEDVARRTGVELDPFEVTGDSFLESLRNAAISTTEGASVLRNQANRKLMQVYNLFRQAEKGAASRAGSGALWERASRAWDEFMNGPSGLLTVRRANARRDFAMAARQTNNEPVIPVENFKSSLDELIAENSGTAASRKQLSFARELKSIKESLEGKKLTAMEMQDRLSSYGKAAEGKASLWRNLDSAQDRRPARELFNSLRRDLDEAADAGISPALREARDNYSQASAAINEVRESSIGRLFGGDPSKLTPENIARQFERMPPSQIRFAMGRLKNVDPGLEDKLQEHYLKSFLSSAQQPGRADVINFSPGKMMDLVRDKDRFDAVFSNPATRKQVEDAIDATRRIFMTNVRGTPAGMMPRIKDPLGTAAGALSGQRNVVFIARALADVLIPSNLTRLMLTPSGVQRLKELAKASPKNTARYAALLSGILNELTSIGGTVSTETTEEQQPEQNQQSQRPAP